jgi:hypothetical protein
MYCVEFLDPLRGKFWNFLRTTNYVDETDEKRTTKTERKQGNEEPSCLLLEKNVSAIRRNQVAAATAPHAIPCRGSGRRALAIRVIRAIRGVRGQRSTSGTHVLLRRERGDDFRHEFH